MKKTKQKNNRNKDIHVWKHSIDFPLHIAVTCVIQMSNKLKEKVNIRKSKKMVNRVVFMQNFSIPSLSHFYLVFFLSETF